MLKAGEVVEMLMLAHSRLHRVARRLNAPRRVTIKRRGASQAALPVK
jgi:hypothetical protein